MRRDTHIVTWLRRVYLEILRRQPWQQFRAAFAGARSRATANTYCVDPLEPRLLLSVAQQISGSAAQIDASADLYLKATGGVLAYSEDGSTWQTDLDLATFGSQSLTLSPSSSVILRAAGTLYLKQMDGAGGTITANANGVMVIDAQIATGGQALALNADVSITLNDNRVISTRNVGGGNVQTGASLGDSGSLTMAAPSITISDEAKILAFADHGKQSGDVSLIAEDTASMNWALGFLGFKNAETSTSISIGAATIRGRNVTVTSDASTTKTVDLEDELVHDTRAVVMGDITGDGKADMIVANYGKPTQLYINNGTATPFDGVDPVNISGDLNATSLALADVTGDGWLDLVIGNNGQVSKLLVNNQTASNPFSDTPQDIGDGTDATMAVALADMNGDGRPDLIVANQLQLAKLYINNGTGMPFDSAAQTFGSASDAVMSIAVGDVAGTARPDVVFGLAGGATRLYVNNGTATPLTSVTAINIGTDTDSTYSVALANVTGSAKLDLLVASANQPLRLFVNNDSASPFSDTAQTIGDALATATTLATGDIDGDGRTDLVVGKSGAATLAYLNAGGDTPFTTGLDLGTGDEADVGATAAAALADVTGDGRLDLAVGGTYEVPIYYANTGKADPFAVDAVMVLPEHELATEVDESAFLEFNIFGAGLTSTATSTITIGSTAFGQTATIEGTQDVSFLASALTSAQTTTIGPYLGVTYAKTAPTATVTMHQGVTVTAGADLDMEATTNNTLVVSTYVPSLIATGGICLSIADVDINSSATVESGATINAGNATVKATNNSTIDNEACALGFQATGPLGMAVTVTIGNYDATATATVAGEVHTSGDTTVEAQSVHTKDITRSSASITDPLQNKPGIGKAITGIGGLLSKLSFTQKIGKFTVGQKGQNPKVAIAAGVTIVDGDNTATASVAPGGLVDAGGNVTVESHAKDNVQSSAAGSAGDSEYLSIGGAVNVSNFSNTSTAYIGANATVDADGTLRVKSNAEIPHEFTLFYLNLALPGGPANTDERGLTDAYEQGGDVLENPGVASLKLGIETIATLLATGSEIGKLSTTLAHSGGTTRDNDGKAGIAGGVNVFIADNVSSAYIDDGAQINQNASSATQDVVVEAYGSISTLDVTGQASVINCKSVFGGATGQVGVGGSFQVTTLSNTAHAWIEDNADVSAGRDVTVHADTFDWHLEAAQAGNKSQKLGIEGAMALLNLTADTQAWVEDGAVVDADGDVNVTANNSLFIINATGGLSIGGNAGIGVSGSANNIDLTTKAFIGDNNSDIYAANIDRVTAGGDLTVTADSDQDFWTFSITGAVSTGQQQELGSSPDDPLDGISLPNLFGEEPTAGKEFGFGISGDTALNFIDSDSQAFIITSGNVTAGGALDVEATNNTFLVAGSGAWAYGNDVGAAGSFAWNWGTRTTKAFIEDATIDTGSLTVLADSDTFLVDAAAGVGGARQKAAVAGSVNLNMVSNDVYAYMTDVDVTSGGAVSVQGSNDTTHWSIAGAVAVSVSGRASVGAALTLEILTDAVQAYIDGATQVVAAGDVSVLASNDNHLYAIAACFSGSFSDGVGVGGTAAAAGITHTVQAYVASGVSVDTTNSLRVDAYDGTFTLLISGAGAGGKTAGIGLSAAVNKMTRDVEAYIGDGADIQADGHGSGIDDPQGTAFGGHGVIVDATAGDTLMMFSVGVAGSQGDLAAACSAAVNATSSTVLAWIGEGATINGDQSGAADDQNVKLRAANDTSVLVVAGAAGIAKTAGVGAAGDVEVITKDTRASVGSGTSINAKGNVILQATSDENMIDGAAGVAGSFNTLAIAGSAAVVTVNTSTKAYLADGEDADNSGTLSPGEDIYEDTNHNGLMEAGEDQNADGRVSLGDGDSVLDLPVTVNAGGSVVVAADSSFELIAVAGAVAVTNRAGIGVSNTTLVHNDTTEAYIGQGASITANALRTDVNVRTGQRDGDDNELTEVLSGVAVTATSREKVDTFAASGAVAVNPEGAAGVAGSASVNVLNENTRASIHWGAKINSNAGGTAIDFAADDDASIYVLASDLTSIIGAGGALGGSGSVGAAGGADIATLNKTTLAYVGESGSGAANAKLFANQDIRIQAVGGEDLFSASGSIGAGLYGGIAASAGVYILSLTTSAYVGARAKLDSDGNILIAANDPTNLDMITGTISGGAASAGATGAVPVISKSTNAWIGSNAVVDARANDSAGGITVHTGQFDSTQHNRFFDPSTAVSGDVIDLGYNHGFKTGDKVIYSKGGDSDAAIGGLTAGGEYYAIVDPANPTRLRLAATADDATALTAVTLGAGATGTHHSIVGASEIIPAVVTNSDAVDPSLVFKRTVVPQTQSNFKGLAVTAVATSDIETLAGSGGYGGFNVAIVGSVVILSASTLAHIDDNAQVNQGDTGEGDSPSVLVAAGSDYYHMGIVASLSGGGAYAGGPAADIPVSTITTKAYIGDADVDANSDIAVRAQAAETYTCIVGGVAGAGTLSISGTAGVIYLDGTTHAYIADGATVIAGGNILVTAIDDTDADMIVGSASLGIGGAGLGVSIGVLDINKDTQAYIGNATISAAGNSSGTITVLTGEQTIGGSLKDGNGLLTTGIHGLAVQARSSEDAFVISAAGGLASQAGFAGAISIEMIDSDTAAYIEGGASINQVEEATPNAAQAVNVSAANDAKIHVIDGSIGGGLYGGVAGGVDVGILRNDVLASIGDGAMVSAAGSVDVNAVSSKDVSTIAASVGAGAVGLGGAVSVWTIGGNLDADSLTAMSSSDSSANAAVDSLINGIGGLMAGQLGGYSDANINAQIGPAGDLVADEVTGQATGGVADTAVSSGTVAFIGDATVRARSVDVDAREQDDVFLVVGGLGVGLAGVGAGVGIGNIDENVQAYIGSPSTATSDPASPADIWTTGSVTVDADFNEDLSGTALAGAAGYYVALGAGVAIFNDHSDVDAYLGRGAGIGHSSSVAITADTDQVFMAESTGGTIGSVAAGAAIAHVTADGETKAFLAPNAVIGRHGSPVGSLSLIASAEASPGTSFIDSAQVMTRASAVAAGIVSGSGSDAASHIEPTIDAYIGDGAAVRANGAVTLKAQGKQKVYALAQGINVAIGAAVGVAIADATSSPTINSYVGSNVTLVAGSINVISVLTLPDSGYTASSLARGATGGLLIGVNATQSDATATSTVQSYIGSGSSITVSGTAAVSATTNNKVAADVSGVNAGILAVGANISDATITANTYAYLGSGVQVSAGVLSLYAGGSDNNWAHAKSGSGGVLAGAGAEADTSTTSTTKAYITGGDASKKIQTDSLTVTATHTATFNGQSDSINAAVVGASGAYVENTADSTVEANIGANAWIETEDFVIYATSNTRKPWLPNDGDGDPTYNVYSGSGGVIDAPAGKSTSNIANHTAINFDHATIIVEGDRYNPGRFQATVANDVQAYDRVSLDSGGVIAVAKATSEVKADTNDAKINVSDSLLQSVGDIHLSTRAQSDIKAQASAKTYGAAGAAIGYSMARFNYSNQVNLTGTTHLYTLGNVNLMSGLDGPGHENRLLVYGQTDLWNKTVFPVDTDPESHGQVNGSDTISISSGTLIEAVGDANFRSEKGLALVQGMGTGTDFYRELASDLGLALDLTYSDRTINQGSGVTIDGTVHVGIHNQQRLHLIGNITEATPGSPVVTLSASQQDEGITFSGSWQSQNQILIDELNRLQDLRREYGGETDVTDALDAEISRVKAQLLAMGQATEKTTDSGTTIIPLTGQHLYVVEVSDIWAQSANINVTGDYLAGSGSMTAPGDATIQVINDGPFMLKMNRLTIPEEAGGLLKFNDVSLTSNSDITSRNSSGTAAFSLDIAGLGGEPLIEVLSNYDPATPGNNPDAPPPDIQLAGDVSNLSGTIRIRSEAGSVLSQASVDGKTIEISAGGDFVQSYVNTFYHVGGDPKSHISDVTTYSKTNQIDYDDGLDANAIYRAITLAQLQSDWNKGVSSSIVASNVFISARYLNLNGVVQAGRPTWSVTIPNSIALQNEIAADETNYAIAAAGGWAPPQYYQLSNVTGNVKAYWDALNNRIEIEGVQVQGGYMELSGRIMATETGNLKVLDGYGTIAIDNQTSYTLVTNRLDAGSGVEGKLQIMDTVKTGGDGKPLVTIYTHVGNNVQIVDSTTRDASGNPNHAVGTNSNTRLATYQPKADQRYTWVTGQRKVVRETDEYRTTSFWGMDWIAPDPGDLYSTTTTLVDATDMLEGEYIDDTPATSPLPNAADNYGYTYDYTLLITSAKTQIGEPERWTTTNGWWIFSTETYHVKYTYETGEKDINVFSIDADHPVNIEFIGQDAGSISVSSSGSLVIDGNINNLAGTTTLTAAGSIDQPADEARIVSKDLTISAGTGIGATNKLVLDMQGGTLSATTTSGDISLEEKRGGLTYSAITTGDGNVTVLADGSLTPSSDTALIQGGHVTLTSTTGTIGVSTSLPALVDTGLGKLDGLDAWADGSVWVKESAGDLQLVTACSTVGDVYVEVASGNLIDYNFDEIIDTRTIDDMRKLWDGNSLIGPRAQAAADTTVSAYEQMKDREYQAYWTYRNQQPDPSVYDPSFHVHLTATEAEYYRNTLGWSDAAIAALEQKRTDEYHYLHDDGDPAQHITDYGLYGDTYNPSFTYTATADEIAALTSGFSWTENQLEYTISAAIFKESADTETLIESPNARGRNVTFVVNSGGIGTIAPQVTIDLDNLGSTPLTDDQKIALSAAERGDLLKVDGAADTLKFYYAHNLQTGDTFSYPGGWGFTGISGLTAGQVYYAIRVDATTIKLSDTADHALAGTNIVDLTADHLLIGQKRDVDFQASGTITSTSRDHAWLGTEVDATVDSITAGGDIRLKAGGAITAIAGKTNITGGNLIIEAAGGHIGASSDAPIRTDLTDIATLTARASGNINIAEQVGPMNVDYVYSPLVVDLRSAGSILDAYDDTALNIHCSLLYLSAGGSIGTSSNFLETDLFSTPARIDADAAGGIYLDELVGDMNVGLIHSTGGDVSLVSAFSILDYTNTPAANVIGNNITLTALGGVGAPNNDLDIDTKASTGKLNIASRYSVYVIEVSGDLTIEDVTVTTGKSFIVGPASILNGNPSGNNVTAEAALFRAGLGIGTSGSSIQTNVGNLEGQSGSDGVYLINHGSLVIGGVSTMDGVQSTGNINISATSPITVDEDVITDGTITMTAGESAGSGDDLFVSNGVTIRSNLAWVDLRAGDNLTIDINGTVQAATTVTLSVDYNNTDAAGGILYVLGTVIGASATFNGNSDADTFAITNIDANTPTTINGNGGDDTFNIGSAAAPSSNTGGVLSSIAGDLVIHGGAGSADTLNLDDTGDAAGGCGTLTSIKLTGFGMGSGGIEYHTIEQFNLNLGSGGDDVVILDNGATTTINAGGGDDSFRIGPVVNYDGFPIGENVDGAPTLGRNIPGNSQPMTIDGGSGEDYFLVNRNEAELWLRGKDGDDTFELNTPVDYIDPSQSTMTPPDDGSVDPSLVEYLPNEPVHVNGGDGFDRIIVNGSFLSDHFIVTADGVVVTDSRDADFRSVEGLKVNGRRGDDLFEVDTTIDKDGLDAASTDLQLLEVNGDADNDVVDVAGVLATVTTIVHGGDGADLVTVGGHSPITANRIQGPLEAYGDGDPANPDAGDVLDVNDFGDTADNIGTLTDTQLTGLGMGDDGLTYGTFEVMNIRLGSGNDTFYVVSSNMQTQTNLYLGDGNDTADFYDGQFIGGILDGQGGTDLLTYWRWTNSVRVELERGRATGINLGFDDGVTGIENITGGEGNDFLIGDDGRNVITGNGGDDRALGLGGDDVLFGNDGDDHLFGGEGNDILYSGVGSDYLDGGQGDDQFVVQPGGRDTIVDEAGTDLMDFSQASAGVTVSLANSRGGWQSIDASGSMLSIDGTIENLVGTDFADVLHGNAADNIIYGGDGDDVIFGMGGNDELYGEGGNDILNGGPGEDLLHGGAGDDLLIGGGGFDLADYSDAPNAVRVDMAAGGATDLNDGDSGSGVDTFVKLSGAIGSDFDDILLGSDKADTLEGGLGDDTIDSGSGNDTIIWRLGDGQDRVDGGAGVDTLSLVFTEGDDDAELSSIAAQLVAGPSGSPEAVTATGTEIVDLRMGGGNDSLTIGSLTGAGVTLVRADLGEGDDVLDGHSADVRIISLGGGGNDTFLGGSAADRFDGGTGNDTIDYSLAAAGVDVMLNGVSRNDGFGSRDRLANIETVIGSNFDDKLAAGRRSATLLGGKGNDILTGGRGNDVLIGGEGDDTLVGKGGSDTFVDEPGNDTYIARKRDVLNFSNASAGVTVDLLAGITEDSTGGHDRLIGVRTVIGSPFDDSITGSSQADWIRGGAGSDTIRGDAGNDTIVWQAGDGVDAMLDGGAGKNALQLIGDNAAADDIAIGQSGGLLQINWNGSGNTQAGNIANLLVQTGGGNDFVVVTSLGSLSLRTFAVQLGDGDDTFDGRLTSCPLTVLGGAGDDHFLASPLKGMFDGGAGNDTIDYSGAPHSIKAKMGGTAVDLVTRQKDHIRGFETLIGTAFDDQLTGGRGNDVLIGGAGNDTLIGTGGSDRLRGGEGNDILIGLGGAHFADYSAADDAVSVDLAAGTGGGGDEGDDILRNIRGVIGSDYDDGIAGGATADTLVGGGGDDMIDGRGGRDIILWQPGDGWDTIDGGTGRLGHDGIDRNGDIFRIVGDSTGAAAFSWLGAGPSSTQFTFQQLSDGSGSATVLGGLNGSGIERIEFQGGSGDDTMTVDDTASAGIVSMSLDMGAGNDTLAAAGATAPLTVHGGDGDDALQGGRGDDLLFGDAGNDTLSSGGGNDTLIGGHGADAFIALLGNVRVVSGGQNDGDRLDFSTASEGITIDLARRDTQTIDASGNTIRLVRRIRNVLGSNFADTIYGMKRIVVKRKLIDDGADMLVGNGGNDFINGRSGDDVIIGGFATLNAAGKLALLDGNDGDDTLIGGAGDDIIVGGGGDDSVSGGSGDDLLIGGYAVVLGTGEYRPMDRRDASDGNDTIDGGTGSNTLYGGTGADILTCEGGNDYFDGGTGDDSLTESSSRAWSTSLLIGWTGSDVILGGAGNDRVFADEGNDTVNAADGFNFIDDGPGDDNVTYSALRDVVVSGHGTDTTIVV